MKGVRCQNAMTGDRVYCQALAWILRLHCRYIPRRGAVALCMATRNSQFAGTVGDICTEGSVEMRSTVLAETIGFCCVEGEEGIGIRGMSIKIEPGWVPHTDGLRLDLLLQPQSWARR